MTALTANITATQTLIPVDAGLTNGSFQLPLYYTVDSEAILVTGRAHRTTWLVERGIAGTTAATHSSAATLTRYYPEAATGAGAGGVTVDNTVDAPFSASTFIAPGATESAPDEADLSSLEGTQRVRLLGPFNATWETPDIADPGGDPANIAPNVIPSGATVILAWAEPLDAWATSTGEPFVGVSVGPASNQDEVFFSILGGDNPPQPPPVNRSSYIPAVLDPLPRIITMTAIASVWARVVDGTDDSAPTAGEMDVYVLIAEPAA